MRDHLGLVPQFHNPKTEAVEQKTGTQAREWFLLFLFSHNQVQHPISMEHMFA
jgi:hypothetical protein